MQRRKRRHRLDFYALEPIFETGGISSPELAEACRLPFENFRKREKQWEKRLVLWVVRVKLKKHFLWQPRKNLTLEKAIKEWHRANKS